MKVFPSKEEFLSLAKKGYSVISVYSEIIADLETPVSCYMKVKDKKPSFLLESVEGGEKLGRYSTIGINPAGIIKVKDNKTSFVSYRENLEIPELANLSKDKDGNPFDSLELVLKKYKSQLGEPAGLVGALSYDSVRFVEPVPNIKVDKDFPDAIFLLSGDSIIFDHLKKTLRLNTCVYINKNSDLNALYEAAIEKLNELKIALTVPAPAGEDLRIIESSFLSEDENLLGWKSNLSKEEFENVVEVCKEHIRAGEVFQIVPSQQLFTETKEKIEPLYLYRLLRSLNPSPYLFLLDFGDFQMIGSSPELMVKSEITENKYTAILRPIAGTYRRGKNEEEDRINSEKLKSDKKELAEHLMLVDLARNDLGRIAKAGTVRPNKELMYVERYSHVLHIVSEMICDVKDGMSSIDLLKATFPAGTLSGAPKVRAVQILSEVENVARGFYGGCIGFLGFDGSCNTGMTIRTVLVRDNLSNTGSLIRLQVGCGVVYDSVPSSEYQETISKAAALLKVVEKATER